MPVPRPRRLRSLPVSRLFPNMVTIAGLCCGASAIRFALMDRWEMAATFTVIAAAIDGMDGMIARLLKATSRFGAQLDSLADVINFGLAPALIMYLWLLDTLPRFGWSAALLYTVCCALRLARFNTALLDSEDETPARRQLRKRFFQGVPSPAGAMLAIFPLILSFHDIMLFAPGNMLAALYLACVAVLMASRTPTFTLKHLHIHPRLILPVMVAAAAALALLIMETWWMLSFLTVLYLGSIPFSVWRYREAVRTIAREEQNVLAPQAWGRRADDARMRP